MVIKIKNFNLSQNQYGGFDLTQEYHTFKEVDGKKVKVLVERQLGYNMNIEHCIKKIIHLIQCESEQVVNLKQFLKSYKQIEQEILNILD